MSERHTPGPWNNYQGDDIYCVYAESGKKICSIEPVDIVGWNAVHREEADANEALIAAAPELLEALELVNDCLVKCLTGGEVSAKLAGKAIQQAALVIEKARGTA